MVAACSPKQEFTPQAPGPAAYGEVPDTLSGHVTRLRTNAPSPDWQKAAFSCVQTELSPATLFHCASTEISFFTGLTNYGLAGPTHLACSSRAGIKTFKPNEIIKAEWLEECWLLVWFAGAPGWTNWDSPWAVYLQHRPSSIRLNDSGLHLRFPKSAGDLVLLPLYGYFKPSPPGADFLAQHGLPSKKLRTWEWTNALPREPLMRVRYWASALREFPLYCQDSFSVDRSKDTVTIRQAFSWHAIDDDWKTEHIKLAPVSPPLALAAMEKKFPVRFSKAVLNHDYFTPYGPYMGIEGVDAYDATFQVLQYINETEARDPATNTLPVVHAALEKLQATARNKFRSADKYEYDHGGLGNFCWAIQGDQWYAEALPYLDSNTRDVAIASLRKYFHDDVLVTNRFKVREYPKASGREYYILEGPGIGSWNVLGDAGKFSANMLQSLWAYAHFTGDWDLIKERWPLIRKLFCTPAEARWVSFGRDAIAELGDEAAPCIAMARMAYRVGDLDTYNYACSMTARELVHHYVKQLGAEYYRRNQPWHSMEAMDEEVYLTNLWDDLAAWQIDGPKYPQKTGERQFNNRWVRFKDSDVGRFYRDYLPGDVQRELDGLQARWDAQRKYHNDSHIMPSLVQLRSLLLNESPDQLASVAMPNQFTGPPSGIIASCLSIIRTSHPTRYIRLIPGGNASPFVPGLERDVPGPNPYLAQAIQTRIESGEPAWPEITWWKSWKTPTGKRWSFGNIEPNRGDQKAPQPRLEPLNWNSQAIIYEKN